MELVSCVSWVRLSVRLRLVPSLHESCLLSRAALDVPTPANANADKTAGTRTSVDLRNRRIPTPPNWITDRPPVPKHTHYSPPQSSPKSSEWALLWSG